MASKKPKKRRRPPPKRGGTQRRDESTDANQGSRFELTRGVSILGVTVSWRCPKATVGIRMQDVNESSQVGHLGEFRLKGGGALLWSI